MRRYLTSLITGLLVFLCNVPFWSHAAAQHNLEQLLVDFESAYREPEHVAAARESLRLRQLQLETALLPALSLRQRAALGENQHLTLDLDLSVVVPLFVGTNEPEQAVLRQRLVGYESEARWSALEARLSFLRDLLSTALLKDVAHETSTALDAFRADYLPATLDLTALLRLNPRQRELLMLEQAVGELRDFAVNHLTEVEGRLRSALVRRGQVELPPFQALLDIVGSTVPSQASCLSSAPARFQAEQRYQEQVLVASLERVLPLQIELHAQANHIFGPGDSHGTSRASVALQARLPLPEGWPLHGSLDISAGSTGVDQQLRLNWPPAIDLSPTSGEPDQAALQLAATLDELGSELAAQRKSLARAQADVQTRELQLLWLARDFYGAEADDPISARQLAFAPFPDAATELQATQLRAQLAFARLAAVEQVLELRLACGQM